MELGGVGWADAKGWEDSSELYVGNIQVLVRILRRASPREYGNLTGGLRDLSVVIQPTGTLFGDPVTQITSSAR